MNLKGTNMGEVTIDASRTGAALFYVTSDGGLVRVDSVDAPLTDSLSLRDERVLTALLDHASELQDDRLRAMSRAK